MSGFRYAHPKEKKENNSEKEIQITAAVYSCGALSCTVPYGKCGLK